jgi:hypothetical protein
MKYIRTHRVLIGFILVLAAAVTAGAAISASLRTSDIPTPRIAALVASHSGVSDAVRLATSPQGRASVVAGTRRGEQVVAVSIGTASTPYQTRAKFLKGNDIVAFTSAGGSSDGSVDWAGVAGIVSQRVARVEVEYADGQRTDATLVRGAFAVEFDPSSQPPVGLVALDANGQEVGTFPLRSPEVSRP